MKATSDRRLAIRDYISVKRQTTLRELTDEFGVSKSTIRRDLDAITATSFFEMVPGNGGGIRAIDGWYASNHYLTVEQEVFLQGIQELQPGQEKIRDSILVAFGRPKQREQYL